MKCSLMLLPFWWWHVWIDESEGEPCTEYLHDGFYWNLLLFIADKLSDVQLLCRQVYATDFLHGLTCNAP